MSAKLIKGTEIREEILEEITADVAQIKEKHGVVPGLVTILVGENPASMSYVTLKIKDGPPRRFQGSPGFSQPEDISEADLLALIDKYNNDDPSMEFWSSCRCPSISMIKRSSTPSIRTRMWTDFIRSMWGA